MNFFFSSRASYIEFSAKFSVCFKHVNFSVVGQTQKMAVLYLIRGLWERRVKEGVIRCLFSVLTRFLTGVFFFNKWHHHFELLVKHSCNYYVSMTYTQRNRVRSEFYVSESQLKRVLLWGGSSSYSSLCPFTFSECVNNIGDGFVYVPMV